MANANVIQDGKEKNVVFDMMNVKFLIVMVMVIVLTVNVAVFVATKANSAKKVIKH